jgi:hypothetical protein
MDALDEDSLPLDLAAELESRFFWWDPVGVQPRSHARILAQAMDLASFDDVRRLEKTLGLDRLAVAMLKAEPGWISERSWEFWRGRLALATGRAMPDAPPRRTFDAGQSGPVKVSFFGGLTIGRVNEPLRTKDATLLVASLEDLLATKLKAIMDRAEAKDYRDISVMLSARVSLERALGAFAKMYGKDPGLPLRAMGYFKDGDLPSLPKPDQDILRKARDRVSEIPEVRIIHDSLAGAAPVSQQKRSQ